MRVGRKAAGGTRRAVLGPCPSEDGGGPGSLPSSPERTECRPYVEGARRGRENEEGFQRVRSRVRQDGAPISVPQTSGIRQRSPSREPGGGGESAATGTRRRSHPGRDLGGSVAPWRFRDGSRGSFPWHGETVSGREAPLSFVRRRSAPELYRGTGMPRRSPCVRSTAGPSTSMT